MHMSRTASKTLKICYVQVCKMTFSFKYPKWAYLKDIVYENNSFQTGSTTFNGINRYIRQLKGENFQFLMILEVL